MSTGGRRLALPLLAQVEERFSGAFQVSYLERGPEAWKLVFVRRG